jgi:hypothetical protein
VRGAHAYDAIDGKLDQVRLRLVAMTPTEATRWRQSALITASFAGQSALVEGLLDDGAAIDGKAWMPGYKPEFFDDMVGAMKHDPRFGGPKAVEGMKAPRPMDNQGENMGPALIVATQCDDAALVDVLLRHHADPEVRYGSSGADVLILAIAQSNADIVRELLDQGVNVCADDRLSRQRWIEYLKKYPERAATVHLTYAAVGRRTKLSDDLVRRLTCPAFDTSSTESR